jgi:hypothetical protein
MALYRLPGSSDPHKTYHVSHALAFASVNEEEMLLRVDGNRLVDGQGHLVVLHGVNRPGAEYQCLQPGGLIFDGPADDASVAAIASWWTNVVRIPLSEDCWLGINHVPPRSSGARYRQAIQAYVHLLHLHGLYAILDLHRSAPGTILATQQYQMADRDHAIDFWRQVATTFKADRGTIFDLFNEPFGLSWQCWRDGGTCADVPFTIAGMQTLITTIRQTGARNVIMVSGVNLANDLSGWIRYQPSDPLHNLVASWHTYGESFACSTPACWRHTLLPAARRVPVVVGEMGEYDCAHTYIESLMPWLDRSGIGYLGWAWVTSSCAGYPALISSYTGTQTNFGIGLRNHLRDLARTPTSSRR